MQTDPLHARDWEELAAVDPLWAIMSSPEKRFGNWRLDDFLGTGEKEIGKLIQSAERLGLPKQHGTAIDFGCGVGRLTRALRKYFPECYGVDISQGMLRRARNLTPECEFRHDKDLRSFPDHIADFLYCSMVLQHQPSLEQVAVLIEDFVRVIAPGGLLVFQMPLYLPIRNRLQLRRRAYRLFRALGVSHEFAYERMKLNPIRMQWMPQDGVTEIVKRAGGVVVQVTHTTEFSAPFTSGLYYCTVK